MADFPSARFTRPVIGGSAPEAFGAGWRSAFNASNPGSGAWPSANRAIFIPFALPCAFVARRVWWANGATVAGNVDCGVYTPGGQLMFSCGSTVQAGTNVVQSVALGADVKLEPGSYFMALAASSTTATFFRGTGSTPIGQLSGVFQQATALPLPASATLASNTTAYLPIFGITSSTVI